MELYDITKDLFTYLSNLRWRVASGEKPSHEEIQKDIFAVFRNQENRIRKHPAMRPGFDKVKYPLVVFADEMILNSDLENAPDWDAMLLEQHFYETNIGGDRFFELLEEAESPDPQVALILYLCLELGFRGRYASDEDTINYLKEELFKAFADTINTGGKRLCPEAYPTHSIKQPRRLPPIHKWHHLIFLVAIIIAVYLLLDRVVVWRAVSASLRHVHELATEELFTPARVPGEREFSDTDTREAPEMGAPSAPAFGESPKSASPGAPAQDLAAHNGYTLQTHALKDKPQALKIINRLKLSGYGEAHWIAGHETTGEIVYYVRTGYFNTDEEDKARKAAGDLKKNEQIDTVVVPTELYVHGKQSDGARSVNEVDPGANAPKTEQ
jgi:type IV/VI secretion system ImpK/VasF family protein